MDEYNIKECGSCKKEALRVVKINLVDSSIRGGGWRGGWIRIARVGSLSDDDNTTDVQSVG